MKLEVYEPKEEIDENIRLRLVDEGDNIELWCVDKDGNEIDDGNILDIDDEGIIILVEDVNPKLGFQLGKTGCVKVDD